MEKLGKKRKVYITNAGGSAHTVLGGEQSNSLSRSMAPVEISDKDTEWAKYLDGKKSATAEVTVNLDPSASSAQKTMLDSFVAGAKVNIFIGEVDDNGRVEGDAFEALITAVNETSDQDGAAQRTFSLQITGAPTHVSETVPTSSE